MVMNPCTNAGDTEEGLIPGSGRSPEEGVETHSSFLAWRIPRTEEPGGPQSYELQSGTTVGTACMQGVYAGFLGGSDGEESACSAGDSFNPWVGKTLQSREWQPPPVFLPGESHGQKSLVGYSPQGHRELDRLSD